MLTKHLNALLSVAGKKDIRYYLNGINIRQYGNAAPVLHATDGNKCMRVEFKNFEVTAYPDCDVIICRTSLSWVLKKFTTKTELSLVVTEEGATINGEKLELINGRYPDICRVIDNHKDSQRNQGMTLGFDPEIVAATCSAVGKFKTLKFQGARYDMYDGSTTSSVISLETEESKVTALMMPCKL